MITDAKLKKDEGLSLTKCDTTQTDISLQIPKTALIDGRPCRGREAIDPCGKNVATTVAEMKKRLRSRCSSNHITVDASI